jgi:hypothetical protein
MLENDGIIKQHIEPETDGPAEAAAEVAPVEAVPSEASAGTDLLAVIDAMLGVGADG